MPERFGSLAAPGYTATDPTRRRDHAEPVALHTLEIWPFRSRALAAPPPCRNSKPEPVVAQRAQRGSGVTSKLKGRRLENGLPKLSSRHARTCHNARACGRLQRLVSDDPDRNRDDKPTPQQHHVKDQLTEPAPGTSRENHRWLNPPPAFQQLPEGGAALTVELSRKGQHRVHTKQ